MEKISDFFDAVLDNGNTVPLKTMQH